VIEAAQKNALCPRCGKAFHCGALDAVCECAQEQLTDALRAELQHRYEGCLCVTCLRALRAEHESRAS
jgi:hypothetical protein